VQRPLGAPIALASEHLRSAADLVGKTVGITGVPSDRAALDTVVAHAGGDPAKVKLVTVGFDGVPYLEAGKIAAFTGYWPDDGVSLQVSGHPITVFKLDSGGGPAYPGLVAFTTRSLIGRDPSLVRAFVRATVHGYEDTLRDPRRSLADLLAANPSIEPKLARASLAAYLPIFDAGGVPDGTLMGSYSNGATQPIARVALAIFTNPGGLEKSGSSDYSSTIASGSARLGTAGTSGFGSIVGGSLEMSNVDLTQEFSNLIVAQRGFEANARIITTSDQILQDLNQMQH